MLFLLALAPAAALAAGDGAAAPPPLPEDTQMLLTESANFVGQLIKLVAFLGGLCALGFLAVKVLGPRLSPLGGKPGDLIHVVDVKRLDPRTALYIVEVGGKHALIAVSDHEVRALSQLELDDELIREKAKERAEKAPPALTFGQVLARSSSKGAPA